MFEKIKVVGAKLEVIVHTVLDWVVAQIKRLDTPKEIAVASVIVATGLDAVTVGHFGVIKFLIGTGKEILEFVANSAQSGGWVFVVCALVAYMFMKELKK